MRNFFMGSISTVLGFLITILEPIAKATKFTWDNTLIKILKLVKLGLQLGGLRK